ncbi:MAG TPA: ABC transporter ATP-binding protein [Bacteroidetes bacterium]|nr:ABC transporter ATP-binding protein [Bacteroidota bacterium]
MIKEQDNIKHVQGKTAGEVMVRLVDLHKSFGRNHVLRGMNLEVGANENVVVIGRSGCGKSVLIKCIIGLVTPDSGSIYVFGEDITKFKRKALIKLRSDIGFLFQSNALYDSLNIRENLLFTLQRRHKELSSKEMTMRMEEVLQNVGLPGIESLMPSELSGGMKKRIALARALILKPKLMLYDEPTTGLDPITSREISQLMAHLKDEYKMPSIIISHDLQCVEITADRIVALIDGVAAANGTWKELSKSADPRVNSFFK